jgi:hypothetical protein
MEDLAAAVVMDADDVLAVVAALRAEVSQLRRAVARLQRENVELRQQAGYWQQTHTRAAERVKQLEQLVQNRPDSFLLFQAWLCHIFAALRGLAKR